MSEDKTLWVDEDFPEVEELDEGLDSEDVPPKKATGYCIIKGRNDAKEPEPMFSEDSIDDVLRSSLFGFQEIDRYALIGRLATVMKVHFDDYIRKVGPEFLVAAYMRRSGDDREICSAPFTADVLSVLEHRLAGTDEKPDILRLCHPDYQVADSEDNIVVPWFRFDADALVFSDVFREGGCRVQFSYAPCMGFGDHVFESPFDYSAPLQAIDKAVADIFALSGRPLDDCSDLKMMLGSFSPDGLKDPLKHICTPGKEYGEIYSLGVDVIVMKEQAQVSFTDSTGFAAKAAGRFEASGGDFHVTVKDYSAAFLREY